MSSTLTTTAAAPAVYPKIREEERLSKAVGEETVVPIIRLRDRPASYKLLRLYGDFGIRRKGDVDGASLSPRPVFVVLGLEGVEVIVKPWSKWQRVKSWYYASVWHFEI